MDDLMKLITTGYSAKAGEEKKSWYSPAADNYLYARPTYPAEIINAVVAITEINQHSAILEIGAGPGTATQAFAEIGCSIDLVEPNSAFIDLAHETLKKYSKLKFHNQLFEEFNLANKQFDIVLAATSFHWVKPEVAYSKAAALLKKDGYLVLMWNKELQPSREIFDKLTPCFETHAPGIRQYETVAEQKEIIKKLGGYIETSGLFAEPEVGFVQAELTYSAKRYIGLLSSYSPYLSLPIENRKQLFECISTFINQQLGGEICLSYVSGFQIAKKL